MTNFDSKIRDFATTIVLAAEKQALKKAVFSKERLKSQGNKAFLKELIF